MNNIILNAPSKLTSFDANIVISARIKYINFYQFHYKLKILVC